MAVVPSPRKDGLVISGKYRVRQKLGAGSVGTVYLADDLSTGKAVALKVLNIRALSPEAIALLQDEFRAFADLRHPQIAHAFDFGYTEQGHLPFYSREYVEGAPLAPGPPGPVGQADPLGFLRPILDLLDALEYLHDHQILHLDIHAGNLIVAENPERGAVLIDFGLRHAGWRCLSSALSRFAPSFPPELLRNDRPGPASDI